MTQDKHTGLTLQGAICQVLAEAPAHEPVDPTPDAEATEGEAYHRDLAWWQAAQMLKAGLAGAPDKAGDREGVDLWCMHILGPNEVHAAPDFWTALAWASELSAAIAGRAIKENWAADDNYLNTQAVAARWPWSAEEHAKCLTKELAERAAHEAKRAALSTGNEEPGREGAIPAIGYGTTPEQQEAFRQKYLSPTPPVSPEPDSRAGVERVRDVADALKAAETMIAAAYRVSGTAPSEEEMCQLQSAADWLAVCVAAIQSAPTASAAAGPVGEDGLVSRLPPEILADCENTAINLANLWADGSDGARTGILAALLRVHDGYATPTPAPHPAPAMEGR